MSAFTRHLRLLLTTSLLFGAQADFKGMSADVCLMHIYHMVVC